VNSCLVCDYFGETGHCDDCAHAHRQHNMLIVAADLGEGAWLAVLCDGCWHRRQYRAELRKRLYGDAFSQVPGVF